MDISTAEKKYVKEASPAWLVDSLWRRGWNAWELVEPDLIHYEKQSIQSNNEKFYRIVRRFDSICTVQNYSTLEFDFNPSYQNFSVHSCTIFREGKDINKLNELRIKIVQKEAQSNEYIYNGIKTVLVFLDDVRERDIIEYSYSYQEFKPHLKDHYIESFFFTLSEDAGRIFYRLIAENEISLKYHQNRSEPIKRDFNNGLAEWIWDIENPKAGAFEPSQPAWFEPYSWAQISSFRTWNEVSDWAKNLFPLKNEPSKEVLTQIEFWRRDSKTKQELATKIIRFVQKEVRYLSIENELDAQAAVEPNETFKRRFGDCKDKTALLCYLLKLVDFESYPALVSTFRKDCILKWAPSPAAFNHAILKLKFDNNVYWIDTTLTFQEGTLLDINPILVHHALVIQEDLNQLERIEVTGEHKVTAISSINLFDDGSGELEVENNFYGSEADAFRCCYKQTPIGKLRNQKNEFYNVIYKNVSVKNDVIIEDNTDLNSIWVKESYKVEGFGERQGDVLVYKYYLSPHLLRSYLFKEIDLTRSSPIGLPYPLNVEEEIRIYLPKSVSIPQTSKSILSDFLEYKSSWSRLDDKTIILKYSLKYLSDAVHLTDLNDFRKFMEQIFDDASVQLTLDFGGNVLPKACRIFFKILIYLVIFIIYCYWLT